MHGSTQGRLSRSGRKWPASSNDITLIFIPFTYACHHFLFQNKKWEWRWTYGNTTHPPSCNPHLLHAVKMVLAIFTPFSIQTQVLPDTKYIYRESLPFSRDNTFLEFPQFKITTSICGRKGRSFFVTASLSPLGKGEREITLKG